MKPRLIKFSCPNCGTRLAVPRHLAGVEDHCPKCGHVVASPVPPEDPVPTVFQTVEDEPQSTPAPEPVPEALSPPKAVPEPIAVTKEEAPANPIAAREEQVPELALQPPPFSEPPLHHEADPVVPPSDVLRDEPAIEPAPTEEVPDLVAPLPEAPLPVPEVTVRPELPLHVGERGTSLLESILRPAHAPLTTTLRPQGTAVAPKAHVQSMDTMPHPLRPLADEPQRVEADEPGMGEILEDHFTQSAVTGVIRHRAPGLGIDLIQMEDSPDVERRERRSRLALRGVLIFIVVDLCIAGWYGWAKIKKWWTYEPPVVHRAVPVKSTPVYDKESPPTKEELKSEEAAAPKTPEPTGVKEAPKTPPEIPPVSQLVPPQNPWSMAGVTTPTGLAPQPPLNVGTPASAPTTDASAIIPATPPAADKAGSESPTDASTSGKQPAPMLPAEIPKSPPSPPPAPMSSAGAAFRDPPSLDPDGSGVVKAIPMDATAANVGSLPVPQPPEGGDPKPEPATTGETPSDRAQAAIVAKVGATFNPLEATTMPLTNEPLPPSAEPAVPEQAKTAMKAAKAFLNAQSWTERLKWSQRPEAIKREMERYYAKRPDGPVKFSSVEFMQHFPAKNSLPAYCMFEVKGPDFPHPVLLLVDQPAKKDAEVDWEAFVEFQGDSLKKFFDGHVSEARQFRVVMRRRHAFERDVPDLDAKDSFEVSHPGADEIFHVYVVHKSEIGRELVNKLPWNSDLPTIVELAWRKQGSQQWVEVRSVVAYGWKS